MKRIHIIIKQDITSIPPIINFIDFLLEHNYKLSFVSSGDIIKRWENQENLKHQKINQNRKTVFHKLLSWTKFRILIKSYLKKEYQKGDLVWIGSADAAIALGHGILDNYEYHLQIHELYDDMPFYKSRLKSFCRNAKKVIVPELNRALIFRSWYGLEETPYVIPNKPYIITESETSLPQEVVTNIDNIKKDYKILFLYQGMISKKRDIIPFIDVFNEGRFDKEAALILIGPIYEEHLKKKIKDAKNVFYLGEFKPPMHLEVTKLCDVGILTYSYINLNNLFCAPNKIWEYTAYGLPVISNFLPGINNFILDYKSGEIIDNLKNKEEVESVIKQIYNNFDLYKKGIENLYLSVDLKDIYRKIIES
jgi:glycosyltransferase involved in cell wall biosynthesis